MRHTLAVLVYNRHGRLVPNYYKYVNNKLVIDEEKYEVIKDLK